MNCCPFLMTTCSLIFINDPVNYKNTTMRKIYALALILILGHSKAYPVLYFSHGGFGHGEANKALHRRLVANGTPHDYSERPGAHAREYSQNSLPYHVLFFSKVFKEKSSFSR